MKRFSGLINFSLLILMLSACDSETIQTVQVDNSDTEQVDKLRIVNNGSFPIENLVVRFPEDWIVFGDVAIGETTEYIEVPNGVYRYSAYEFELKGETTGQPVIDWVGEVPMEGTLFTYTIDFDPNRMETREWWVELLNVEIDR